MKDTVVPINHTVYGCDRTFKVAANIRKYYNIFKTKLKKNMITTCTAIIQRHYYPLPSTLWMQNLLFFLFPHGENICFNMVFGLLAYDEDRQQKFLTK